MSPEAIAAAAELAPKSPVHALFVSAVICMLKDNGKVKRRESMQCSITYGLYAMGFKQLTISPIFISV